MDIGALLSKAWEKLQSNIVLAIIIFIVGFFVTAIIGPITLMILGVPIIVGVVKAMRRIEKGETPEIGDVFAELSNIPKWIALWVVIFVIGAISSAIAAFLHGIWLIGSIAASLVGILVGWLTAFTIPLMLDRDMPAFEAAKTSIQKVIAEFGTLLLPLFIIIVLAGVFPLNIVTGPLAVVALWLLYDQVFNA
jgi:hypothetical protein